MTAFNINGNWKGILIGGSVVLLVITILIVVIVILVRKHKQKTVPLPEETSWGKSLSPSQSEAIQRIAKGLYDDMEGPNILTRNEDIYLEYNATDGVVFVGVANYFAEKYGNGENLAQWIDSEWYGLSSPTCKAIISAIMKRLEQYGITAK